MYLPDGYASHYPILASVLVRFPEGPVLELGCGNGSTYLMHEICRIQERPLVTVESDLEWLKQFTHLASSERPEDHLFFHVPDIKGWSQLDSQRWMVAFVDHTPPERRGIEIKRLANICGVIVMHDSNPQVRDLYGVNELIHKFKYKYEFTRFTPNTVVLSNFYDIQLSI